VTGILEIFGNQTRPKEGHGGFSSRRNQRDADQQRFLAAPVVFGRKGTG